MRRRTTLAQLCAVSLGLLGAVSAAAGCGAAASGQEQPNNPTNHPRILSTSEARGLLVSLPYRYTWRKVPLPQGATGALAGKAVGQYHTVVHFGVSLGVEAGAVPVPRAGVEDSYDYSAGGGFVFTTDLEVPGKNETVHPGSQFHTRAQWNEATSMEVAMEEKLCRAATGRPCPP